MAAYRGGAQGLVISRTYSEMKPANLAAVGDALRELKIANQFSPDRTVNVTGLV
ncbi:MAG: hypothetical protein ABSG03_31330 [Bryobacteraceae bacterium]